MLIKCALHIDIWRKVNPTKFLEPASHILDVDNENH